MILSTEDFVQHDICPRSQTYTSRYVPFRVSLNFALNESIHSALSLSNPISASDKLMALAANPGIEIDSKNIYDSAIHHSRLVELLSTYILSVGRLSLQDPISCPWGDFQPRSFLMESGRLRRIVLCDRWTPDRESMERFSWRTAIDSVITNRPMTITALVIGAVRNGFRSSPWTQGFIHPMTSGIRTQRLYGEQFGENWQSTFREQTSLKPLEWLRIMQSDGAFEGRVFSVTQDVPRNRAEVLEQIAEMADGIRAGSLTQCRSSCYRFRPCPFLPACASAKSPAQLNWVEKDSIASEISPMVPSV